MPAPAYDPSNIFARILRGEVPAHRVHEDEATLAFMDIMPRARGHALVIPKALVRNLLDASDADLAAVMRVAARLARAGLRAFGADGVTVQQFSEAAGGQEVFHLHIHVIPRVAGTPLLLPHPPMAEPGRLAAEAALLREALAA